MLGPRSAGLRGSSTPRLCSALPAGRDRSSHASPASRWSLAGQAALDSPRHVGESPSSRGRPPGRVRWNVARRGRQPARGHRQPGRMAFAHKRKEGFHASGHLADPGWRTGHSAVPADQIAEQARGADRGEVSTDRYPRIQLHPLRAEPDLRADAVQLGEPAPPHLQHLQVRSVHRRIRRDPGRAADDAARVVVPGDRRRRPPQHPLLHREHRTTWC